MAVTAVHCRETLWLCFFIYPIQRIWTLVF